MRDHKNEIGIFRAVAARSLLLAAPASAQGVKIGVLNDRSGVYADYGGKYSVEAAKMAIENFGGEVLGQKIELVTADDQNKPDLATSVARRSYEGLDMITEFTTASVALAVQQLSKEKKSKSWWERRPRPSPAGPARPMASIGLSTPTRSRSVPAARW